MAYQISITEAARRGMKRIPRDALKRIGSAIDDLADDPRPVGSTKLAGVENTWRIRVGDYRILYEVHDGRLIVLVIRIGHRRDVYRS